MPGEEGNGSLERVREMAKAMATSGDVGRRLLIIGIVVIAALIFLANLSRFGGTNIVYIDRNILYAAFAVIALLLAITLISGNVPAGFGGGRGSRSGIGSSRGPGSSPSSDDESVSFDVYLDREEIETGGPPASRAVRITAHAVLTRGGRSRNARGERIGFRVESGNGRFGGGHDAVTVHTDADGRAVADFVGPFTIPGAEEHDRVSAEWPSKGKSEFKTIKIKVPTAAPAPNYNVVIAPSNPHPAPGTPIDITATVTDPAGNPAPANVDVTFSVTGGAGNLDPPPVRPTNGTGHCTIQFTTDPDPAVLNEVTAHVTGSTHTLTISTAAPAPIDYTIAAINTVPAAPAPGQVVTITAHVTETATGNDAADGTTITFTRAGGTGNGTFVGAPAPGTTHTADVAGGHGLAEIQFTTDPDPAGTTNTIHAAPPSGASGDATITTTPREYSVNIIPPMAPPNPGDPIIITADVIETATGNPPATPVPIVFSVGGPGAGTLQPGDHTMRIVPTAGGSAEIDFQVDADPAGNINTITASPPRGVPDSLTINTTAAPAALYTIVIQPLAAPIFPGETREIVAEVRNAAGADAPDGTTIDFGVAGADAGFFPAGVNDTADVVGGHGLARIDFTANANPAGSTNTITAAPPAGPAGSIIINVQPTQYTLTDLTATPPNPDPGQDVRIEAEVVDQANNRAPNGTSIDFYAGGAGNGTFPGGPPDSADVAGGVATIQFTADPDPAGGVTNTIIAETPTGNTRAIPVTTTPAAAAAHNIQILPAALPILPGTEVELDAIVTEIASGHAAGAGINVAFAVAAGAGRLEAPLARATDGTGHCKIKFKTDKDPKATNTVSATLDSGVSNSRNILTTQPIIRIVEPKPGTSYVRKVDKKIPFAVEVKAGAALVNGNTTITRKAGTSGIRHTITVKDGQYSHDLALNPIASTFKNGANTIKAWLDSEKEAQAVSTIITVYEPELTIYSILSGKGTAPTKGEKLVVKGCLSLGTLDPSKYPLDLHVLSGTKRLATDHTTPGSSGVFQFEIQETVTKDWDAGKYKVKITVPTSLKTTATRDFTLADTPTPGTPPPTPKPPSKGTFLAFVKPSKPKPGKPLPPELKAEFDRGERIRGIKVTMTTVDKTGKHTEKEWESHPLTGKDIVLTLAKPGQTATLKSIKVPGYDHKEKKPTRITKIANVQTVKTDANGIATFKDIDTSADLFAGNPGSSSTFVLFAYAKDKPSIHAFRYLTIKQEGQADPSWCYIPPEIMGKQRQEVLDGAFFRELPGPKDPKRPEKVLELLDEAPYPLYLLYKQWIGNRARDKSWRPLVPNIVKDCDRKSSYHRFEHALADVYQNQTGKKEGGWLLEAVINKFMGNISAFYANMGTQTLATHSLLALQELSKAKPNYTEILKVINNIREDKAVNLPPLESQEREDVKQILRQVVANNTDFRDKTRRIHNQISENNETLIKSVREVAVMLNSGVKWGDGLEKKVHAMAHNAEAVVNDAHTLYKAYAYPDASTDKFSPEHIRTSLSLIYGVPSRIAFGVIVLAYMLQKKKDWLGVVRT